MSSAPWICRRLLAQTVAIDALRAFISAGSRMPISVAMMPMTTSNSIRVNARLLARFRMRTPFRMSCPSYPYRPDHVGRFRRSALHFLAAMNDRSHLLTELRLPESMNLDAMSVEEAVAMMNAQDAKAVAAVGAVKDSVAAAVKLV